MKQVKQKSMCSGCAMCVTQCPVNAIYMKRDKKGFKYPIIDNDKCIKCGKCKECCPFDRRACDSGRLVNVYACVSKSENVHTKSRSGGFFYELAKYVIENGGVVYGAAFNELWDVRHIRIDSVLKLEKLQGSKYVQSDIEKCYSSVENDINNHRIVLFSGTGCQCHAIKRRFPDNENLILCDIICAGVPSPKVWHDYISYSKRKLIKEINFRDKEIFNWGDMYEKIVYKGHTKYSYLYAELFGSGLIYRESCFNCPYTTCNRTTDFTIGDAWNVTIAVKQQQLGISLVMTHSDKAECLYTAIKGRLDGRKVRGEKYKQPRLRSPFPKPMNYERFWDDYLKKGPRYIYVHYGKKYAFRVKGEFYSKFVVGQIKRIKKFLVNKDRQV